MPSVRASEIGQTFQAPRAIEKIAENRKAPANSSGPARCSVILGGKSGWSDARQLGKPARRRLLQGHLAMLYLAVLDEARQVARHRVDVERLFPEVNVPKLRRDGGLVVPGCEHKGDIAGA